MIASHFVLGDILTTLKSGDIAETEKIFKKFARRYHDDKELKKLYDEFRQYTTDKKKENLKNITEKLSKLKTCRKIESSGRGMLPLKDMCHFILGGRYKSDEHER